MSLKMKYFVLKPESKTRFDPYARASRSAMRQYADTIDDFNSDLAQDLRDWAQKEDHKGGKLDR